MNAIDLGEPLVLSKHKGKRINHIAFDGCHFYYTVKNREKSVWGIIGDGDYDSHLRPVTSFESDGQ